jgi:hypothetical protein
MRKMTRIFPDLIRKNPFQSPSSLKRDNSLRFDGADEGLELEANPLLVTFVELF